MSAIKVDYWQGREADFDKKKMRELRCLNCRAFIMYESIYSGSISIKCPSSTCGELNRITFKDVARAKIEISTNSASNNNNNKKG